MTAVARQGVDQEHIPEISFHSHRRKTNVKQSHKWLILIVEEGPGKTKGAMTVFTQGL